MRLKVAIIVSCFALLLMGTVLVSDAVEIVYSNAEDEVEKMFEIQFRACLANEVLFSSFDYDETYIYPDEFAGDYIDYDTLHVLLTDENAIPEYMELLSEYEDVVVFDIVENSYNELEVVASEFVNDISDLYSVTAYGVDVVKNKALIYLLNQSHDEFISDYCLDIYYEDDVTTINDMIEIAEMDSYVQSESSYVAGSLITTNGHSGTLGGSGTYDGSVAFVTAGHCTSAEGNTSYIAGTKVGTVDVRNYSSGKYGDFAIITATEGDTATSSVFTSSGNITSFNGYLNNPAVGMYLYKYGYTSQQTYCLVTNTNLTVANEDNISIKGVTSTKIISGSSAGGDSGGPYRYNNLFCGVHKGSATTSGTQYTYFTPNIYLYNAGFLIATN